MWMRPQHRRGRHEIIKQERPIHQQREPRHLEEGYRPQEVFPSERETDDPDAKRTARICETARGRAEVFGDAQAEPVEETDADGDGDGGPEYGGGGDHLCPAAVQVEKGGIGGGRRVGEGGEGDEGDKDEDGDDAKEAFEADCDVGGDGVLRHDLFLENELRCSAVAMGKLTHEF